jgi:hypothetical protein
LPRPRPHFARPATSYCRPIFARPDTSNCRHFARPDTSYCRHFARPDTSYCSLAGRNSSRTAAVCDQAQYYRRSSCNQAIEDQVYSRAIADRAIIAVRVASCCRPQASFCRSSPALLQAEATFSESKQAGAFNLKLNFAAAASISERLIAGSPLFHLVVR